MLNQSDFDTKEVKNTPIFLMYCVIQYVNIIIFRIVEALFYGGIIMGKIFRFHKDVDTDQIIASQYLLYPTIEEMKVHTFESLDPEFASKVQHGDFVVADENFGCGSSREQAPGVLKALGVQAVVAKSFARIFYRNAINIGLPVIVCKELYDAVTDGEEMSLDMSAGVAVVKGVQYSCTKLPPYMQSILDQGGLIASLNKEEN